MINKNASNNDITGSVILSEQPRKIVNQEAYDEYLRLKNAPILNDKKYMTASDGTTINLGWFPDQLQRKVEHLPIEEQSKFIKFKKIYFQTHCKMNGMKAKAFGGQADENGETKKSLFAQKEMEMIELFGRMFTIKEVFAIVSGEWKIRCKIQQVQDFRTAHIDAIIKKIEEHKRTYSDIRLGHKRSRLEELTWMYMKRKAMYNASGKADDHRLLLQTIEQIRKEAEGDNLRIDANIIHNIEGAVNDHIEKDLTKNLSVKELIIARVAAKTNTPVARLVADLSRGWYSKMLQVQAEEAIVISEFPSTQNYDFDRIGRIAEAREQETKNQAKLDAISPEVVNSGNDIKALLLAKLSNKKGDVQSELNDLNPRFIDKANTPMTY